MRRLARDLPMIREALYAQLGTSREHTRENHTFGITTLTKRHATVDGRAIEFAVRGKSNTERHRVVVDRPLATLVQALRRTPGTRLFRYLNDGVWHNLTQRDVNDYVRRLTPARYTAKDFRAWGGTLRAAMVLSDLGPAAREQTAGGHYPEERALIRFLDRHFPERRRRARPERLAHAAR